MNSDVQEVVVASPIRSQHQEMSMDIRERLRSLFTDQGEVLGYSIEVPDYGYATVESLKIKYGKTRLDIRILTDK